MYDAWHRRFPPVFCPSEQGVLGFAVPEVQKGDLRTHFWPALRRTWHRCWVVAMKSDRVHEMESPARQISLVPPLDRRQSETALAIARGTARLLRSLGFSCISELPLPSAARRPGGAERARRHLDRRDQIVGRRSARRPEWQDYRMHCDRLFFAFTQDLPCEIFPEGTGLIIADATARICIARRLSIACRRRRANR